MAHVSILDDSIQLDSPYLVDGLPGIGLVGKIATDLLIERFEMEYYANIQCDGLPKLGVYHEDDPTVKPPVRIYADADRDLLALQSEIPVSGDGAPEFASCVTEWFEVMDVTPIYLSGHPADAAEGAPTMFGIATGDGESLLSAAGIDGPPETGAVSGPTGALLHRAAETGLDGVGLVVESDPQFPDPEAAHILVSRGIAPIIGIEVSTDELLEKAETIRAQRQQLAEHLQQAEADESTQARPIGMFQ